MAESAPAQVRRLLVEGPGDEIFFDELLKHLGLESIIQIDRYKGRNNLSNYLTGLPASSDFSQLTHIGIVRDADFDTSALNSIQTAIRNANQRIKTASRQLPEIEAPGKFYGEKLKIAALIPTQPGVNGMREDVILSAFKDDTILNCITGYIDCVREQGIRVVQEIEPKTRLKIFVYTKNLDADEFTSRDRHSDDIYRMSWWSWDKPAFETIKTFLRQFASD